MVVVLDLFIAKLVAIVWLAVTLVKVYDVTAPTDVPSTVTSVSVYPAVGVIANESCAPAATVT